MIPARSILLVLLWPLLLSPAAAQAQSAPAPSDSPANKADFESLWTGWSGVSREAMRAESEAARSGHAAAADVPRRYRAGSVALGERVGEVVRQGDCDEGERLAREAGDFALVDAVRAHCRPAEPQIRSR